MKKHSIFIIALVTLTVTFSCKGKQEKKAAKTAIETTKVVDSATVNSDAPIMTFDKVSHDFGVIKEGDKVETNFTFTNTGKTDLIITNAQGSCGCTVPEYPKDTPIKPGEKGTIHVAFDSNNKPNLQQKTVTLTTNTAKGRDVIRIKAMVTPDPVKQKRREEAMVARQKQMKEQQEKANSKK